MLITKKASKKVSKKERKNKYEIKKQNQQK